MSPTSTSQQCVPELKPSEPRTLAYSSNLSGLSGSCCSSLRLTLVRSSDRTSIRFAVLGSRVTGAAVRNTNGLGGKSTQKEIHTHIQTRGHYLYLYLYLLKQQNEIG